MNHWKHRAGIVLAVGSMFFASDLHAGPKIAVSESGWVKISVLGQVQYRREQDAAAENDFYLRRGRLIFDGQMKDGIRFFMDTDSPNAGKSGNASTSIYIQDAFADLRLLKSGDTEFWAAAGLILLPFSFENKSSAASLLGNDYNSEALEFVNDLVWRDYGVEVHGNFGKGISMRAGVFDGYDGFSTATTEKNPATSLRITGHLAVNIIGVAETGPFYTQERLAKGKYLSLGAGIDTQSKATRTLVTTNNPASVEQDSDAWVMDLQSGFELGSITCTVNAAYYNWDNSRFKGNTMFVEGGAKYGKGMLTCKYSSSEPDSGDGIADVTTGIHYFFDQHNARIGLEYRTGDSKDMILASLQFLL